MKSSPALYIGICAALAASVLLGGCGQPGPLYLPKAPAKAGPFTPAPVPPPPRMPADMPADPAAIVPIAQPPASNPPAPVK